MKKTKNQVCRLSRYLGNIGRMAVVPKQKEIDDFSTNKSCCLINLLKIIHNRFIPFFIFYNLTGKWQKNVK
jgi:hypothetical protein